jgi:hypothetical protein
MIEKKIIFFAHFFMILVKGYEFLSQELRHIFPNGKFGKRFADEVVRVHLKDGSVKCLAIFIHIEVQGKKDKYFPERTYVYNYRIYDKKREGITEVITLVVLTDENPNYRPDEFQKQLIYKIDRLEEENNMPYVTSWEKFAREEGIQLGKKEGIQLGKKEGIQLGKKESYIEMARKLIKKGIDLKIIAETTGLSLKKIKAMASNG